MITQENVLPIALRLSKSVLAISIGIFACLVAYGNLVDFQTNWQFVQHVLAMDTLQPWLNGAALRERAVTDVHTQKLCYYAIILTQWLVGALCLVAGGLLLRSAVSGHHISVAKAVFVMGATVRSNSNKASGFKSRPRNCPYALVVRRSGA